MAWKGKEKREEEREKGQDKGERGRWKEGQKQYQEFSCYLVFTTGRRW